MRINRTLGMRLVCGSAHGQQQTKVTSVLTTVVPNKTAWQAWNTYFYGKQMGIQGFHAIPNLYLLDDNSSRLVFPNCDYQSDLQILITFPQTAKSTPRKATTPKNGKSRALEGRGKSVEASRKT